MCSIFVTFSIQRFKVSVPTPENIHYKSTEIWMEIASFVVGFVGPMSVSFCCTQNWYLNLPSWDCTFC
jgi:hypothetical protein